MAIMITDECIICHACEPECPNNAIYLHGTSWKFSEGTGLQGDFIHIDLGKQNAEEEHSPISEEYYYIVPHKCTECEGFHEEPQCAAVCPVDCCVPDPDYEESKEVLLVRQQFLHQ